MMFLFAAEDTPEEETVVSSNGGEIQRPINLPGKIGKRLLCISYGSFRHLLQQWPHSWQDLHSGGGATRQGPRARRSLPYLNTQ